MNLGHETEQVEFKKSTGEHREAVESIAAILNKHGKGTLYFGVRNDGEVVGQEVSDTTLRSISQEIAARIEPVIHPVIQELTTDDGKHYIRVDFEGTAAPYACSGRYRIRQADEDVLMTPELVGRMFVEASDRLDPWDGKLSDQPVSDADEKLVRRFVDHGIEKGRLPDTYREESTQNVLEHLGLARNGFLTNAATVLFCPAKYWFRLSMAVLAGNDRVNILDLQHELRPVLELIDAAEYYVIANIRRRIVITGAPQRDEIPEIPRAAIREAIINAFCHKKYRGDARVMIDIFTDAVEITNPGLFPADTSPEAYLSGERKASESRNPLLARALFRGGYIEELGSGVKRIKEACDAEGVCVEYRQLHDETTVVFHRPGSQVEYVYADDDERAKSKSADYIKNSSKNRQQKSAAKIGSKNRQIGESIADAAKKMIVAHLASAERPLSRADIAEAVGLGSSRTRDYLRELVSEGAVVSEGKSRATVYRIAHAPVQGEDGGGNG